MNKRIMLLTALIAASPVLHVAASAETMYNDIKIILEDRVVGKTDGECLYHIQHVLGTVKCYKEDMQNQIISLHSRVDHDKPVSLMLGALSTLCFGISSTGCFNVAYADRIGFALLGAMTTGAAVFAFCKRNIDCYNLKNKINELTAVIVKLEAMELSLQEKLQPVMTINA